MPKAQIEHLVVERWLIDKLLPYARNPRTHREAVQAIAENPRVVQAAALSATKANSGRRELLSLQLSPGTLTS